MPFSSLIGNERIKLLLQRAVAEGRLGHGLLMAGPPGVGKHQFALALAQAVNCEHAANGDACGDCVPCRKIAAGEHADVQTITPDGAYIKIGQMREMSREAQFRPYEGRRRVLIVDDAHRLLAEAANSILKTLEEPPPTSLIILVTPRPYALLETIRSRCLMLSFAPLTVSEVESHLAGLNKGTPEEIGLIARLARGSIGRALQIDLKAYRSTRLAMLELVDTVALTRDTVRLINAAEYLGRKLERPEFEDHLDALMVILSDLFRLKLSEPPDSLTNTDVAGRLARAAEKMTLEQILGWADQAEQVMQALNRNVNRQLAVESMLISL